DERDAGIDDAALPHWTQLQKPLDVLFAAKSHDAFDSGPVVPTAVEEDDLARCREVRQVTLDVELRFLALGGRRQRDDAKHPGADPFGDRLDDTTLSGGIAALEDHHDPQSLVLYPQLQLHELALQ